MTLNPITMGEVDKLSEIDEASGLTAMLRFLEFAVASIDCVDDLRELEIDEAVCILVGVQRFFGALVSQQLEATPIPGPASDSN